jgi:hypothetical protein
LGLNLNLCDALLIQTIFDLNHGALLLLCLPNRVACMFSSLLAFSLFIHVISNERAG